MNENESTVRLLIPEDTAINLLAVLGNGMTQEVCEDLELHDLYNALHDHFGRTRLEGTNDIIGRLHRDVAATVSNDNVPRYTSIDLT